MNYTIQEFDSKTGWKRKKKVTKEQFEEYMVNKGYCPECKVQLKTSTEEGNGCLH